jgi:hypothetical protein
MNPAFLTAFAIIAGSALGGAMSLASAWLTQNSRLRADQIARRKATLESLYGDFIDEASKLYARALVHDTAEPSNLVGLYSKIGKMRIQSSSQVVASAESAARTIMETYLAPNKTFPQLQDEISRHNLDPLRDFSDVCREELRNSPLDTARRARLPAPGRWVSALWSLRPGRAAPRAIVMDD